MNLLSMVQDHVTRRRAGDGELTPTKHLRLCLEESGCPRGEIRHHMARIAIDTTPFPTDHSAALERRQAIRKAVENYVAAMEEK